SLTDPGGICITQQVYDHVRKNEEFRMVALGQNRLKNVQTPTEVYRVLPASERGEPTKTDALEPRRVAALPLAIISSDQQDEYFADGLTEEIINTLSSIPGLKVIARTSVMKYKEASKRGDWSLCSRTQRTIPLEQEEQGRPREGNSLFWGSNREGSKLRHSSRGYGGLLYSDGTPSLPPCKGGLLESTGLCEQSIGTQQ